MLAAVLLLGVFYHASWPVDACAADDMTPKCTKEGVLGGVYDDRFEVKEQYINGFVSGVAKQISSILVGLSHDMFTAVANGLAPAIQKLASLYIMIYGILFMFGAVPVTLWEFLTRALKVAIVMSLVTGSSEIFNLMYKIFECGTDEITNVVIGVMTGGNFGATSGCEDMAAGGGASPLAAVDELAAQVFSSKMIVTVLAVFTAGVHGVIIGMMLLLSIRSILMSILNAMWVYLMAKVVRALLFGVAPLFIACIFFKHTKHMFDGWINQLINSSLQPIFLFAFFTFFVGIMTDGVRAILSVPVCMTPLPNTAYGAPFDPTGWRHAVNKNPDDPDGEYEIYEGLWGNKGAKIPGVEPDKQPEFPIDPLTVILIFVIAELAFRFNSIVLAAASGIAHSSLNFSQMKGVFSTDGLPAALQGGWTGGGKKNTEPDAPNNVGRRGDTGGSVGGSGSAPGGGVGGSRAQGSSPRTTPSQEAAKGMSDLSGRRPTPGG